LDLLDELPNNEWGMKMRSRLSSQQIQKKQREKELLAEFGALYADFPVGTVIESEEPDFLIKTSSQILGIEVLEFHKKENSERSSRIRERESFHEQLAEQAQSLFEEKHPIPLQVIFHGHGHQRNVRPHDRELLATSVADLVRQYISLVSFQTVDFNRITLRDTAIGRVIHSFSITKLKADATGLWAFTETSAPETSFDELQQEISIKDAKIEKYLEQCSSVWLLIGVGGRYIATMADFPRDHAEHPFRYRFERVLIYNRVSKSIVPLVREV
jgi:hypothetical protein